MYCMFCTSNSKSLFVMTEQPALAWSVCPAVSSGPATLEPAAWSLCPGDSASHAVSRPHELFATAQVIAVPNSQIL